jgi:murein DD-endopeptidase MepM/ murein hydrolase activator NlpD
MSFVSFESNGFRVLSQAKPKFMKVAIAAAMLAMGCAAAPLSAKTVTDNDDDGYSDVQADVGAPRQTVDSTFASLMGKWRKMDGSAGNYPFAAVSNAIWQGADMPSGRPVQNLELTSNYGYRRDPFNGHARMHKGIDIPGPVGTPIYATADGYVVRSQVVGGYGNLIELSHGNDVTTRYGHLSRLLVKEDEIVHRGQLIALMGSTGRSTGSHLHYEVRIAGEAVNPLPYVLGAGTNVALNKTPPLAVGGPEN